MKGDITMAKEKATFDFNKLKLEDMVNYVVSNEAKERINLKDYLEVKEKYKLVNVNDAEGKPQTYVSKKTGKIKIKKKQIPTGEKTERYNLFKAKRDFYTEFKNDINWINPPKVKKAKEEKKATDILSLLD